MAVRAPAPRLIGDERLVGVEAGEVVDVGVMILGGTPRDQAIRAKKPCSRASSRAAAWRVSYSVRSNPTALPSHALLGVSDSRMTPRSAPIWQSCCRLQYSCLASELRRHGRHAKPTTIMVPLTVSSPHQLYEEAGRGQNHSRDTLNQLRATGHYENLSATPDSTPRPSGA